MKVFILFCLLGLSNGQENFCNFFCACGFEDVTCVGVSIFPIFESTQWIKRLTIIQSDIRSIPVLSEFDFIALELLKFEACPFLSCTEIDKFSIQRPDIDILTDQNCFQSTQEITTIYTTDFTFEQSTDTTQDSYESTTKKLVMTESSVISAANENVGQENNNNNKTNLSATTAIIISCIALGLIVVVLACIHCFKKRSRINRIESNYIEMHCVENPNSVSSV